MTPGDLIDLTGIAELCGVGRTAVANWRNRHDDFPDPWGTWAMGSLWKRDEIEAWTAGRIAAQEAARAEEIARLEGKLKTLKKGTKR